MTDSVPPRKSQAALSRMGLESQEKACSLQVNSTEKT